MKINKRKLSLIGLTALLGLFFISILSVSIQSNIIEKEFSALRDYSKLFYHYDTHFKWEKRSHGIWRSYTYSTSNFYSYRISPIGKGFIAPEIAIVKHKYKNFPEDIWADFTAEGIFYYPTSDCNDKEWGKDRAYAVSFDKAYSIAELQEFFTFGKLNWLWLDTYGTGGENLEEYYIQNGNAANGAYGVICNEENRINNLQADALKFVEMINKYNTYAPSKTGNKLYDIKCSIKSEGDITIEDLRVIGCIFYPDDSQDEQMQNAEIFKVVK